MGSVQLFGQQRRSVALSTMKSTVSVGVAVISSVLLIGHFCTFVSCGSLREVQPGNPLLISNQRTKRSACGHHTKSCTSTGDPHITTFEGAYYHLYGTGVYTLLKLNNSRAPRALWIQTKHVSCNGQASCNCGVMAREGNSIIGITKCNQESNPLVKYELKKGAVSGSIRTISGGWRITLVSGIEIEATVWENGQFLHLYVKGLTSENYEGLCSVKQLPHNSVCNGQKCDPYRVKDYQNFFRIPQGDLPKQCENSWSPTQNCAGPGDVNVDVTDITKVCNSNFKIQNDDQNDVSKNKKYIGLNNSPKGTEKVDRGLNMNYRFFDVVRSLNPRAKLSVEDGRSHCNAALKLSPTYEICSGRVDTSAIVEECALDVNLMNEYGPAKSVPTEFETACLDNIRLSLESDTISEASLQELKDLLTRVEKLVCPLQCSQNGRCVDSKCQCNEGFMGTDCSLRIGQVPVIQKIITPVCDIREHPCTQIHVEASDLAISENVVCKMRSVDDVDGAVPALQTSTPGISEGLALCNLPQIPVSTDKSSNGKSTTVFLVQVSISNDGQTYSQELPFTVFDGQCMECPASQNTPCQLKENTCSIGGRCYKAEDSCPLDAAKICNPAKCATKWTSESSTNCDDGFENCT